MDLDEVVRQARAGSLEAFETVTRRFQHMALGSALALVRDPQQAQDVVQEAFVAAWFSLPTIAEPAAFPGWLRSIVRHQAHRVLRRSRPVAVPLDLAEAVPATESGPRGAARTPAASRSRPGRDRPLAGVPARDRHALLRARVLSAGGGIGEAVAPEEAGGADPAPRGIHTRVT